ncbi:MAG: glutamine-hydrolyzing GMP synthase [archaeon GB-1867-035]|nr:glutamine-hydrolyzing GMP synthase [Candidatus Culexmicrobium profundum]
MSIDKVAVIDFGSQYTHLIARRIRELRVYSEVVPYNVNIEEIEKIRPKALILSGGPRSVYEKSSPKIKKEILDWAIKENIPILGICYGHQLIVHMLGGKVERGEEGEYGISILKVLREDIIFHGAATEQKVWMSHKDQVVELPPEFIVLASTQYTPIAAYKSNEKQIYGLQFHPEVKHTKYGMKILRNFLYKVCKCKPTWKLSDFIERKIREIRKIVGNGNVIMAASGGVDSTTAAYIISKAVGERLHLVYVNTGLMRENEDEEVMETFRKLGFKNVHYINAKDIFLERLKGVVDPEKKRQIIAKTFIEIFENKAKELEKKYGRIEFLGQGTIYPDRIESGQASPVADRIKSHHNVVLPKGMKLRLIEPIADLYKDEVRRLALEMGLPRNLVKRHPFPGPGLAIRIIGEVTEDKLRILRKADKIVEEEMKRSGWYWKVWQAFPVLLSIKTVGVMGDQRAYEYAIALRVVYSEDGMTADFVKIPWKLLEKIASRIVNEVERVNRVLYDVTNKPPATIEFE